LILFRSYVLFVGQISVFSHWSHPHSRGPRLDTSDPAKRYYSKVLAFRFKGAGGGGILGVRSKKTQLLSFFDDGNGRLFLG
jgi:hypothetical protein